MGIFTRLARPKNIRNLGVTDPKAWNSSLWNMVGGQSLSGENVDEHTALTYSAVWNAVSLISGTISTLPLHLLRPDAGKTKQVTEKKLFRIMHSQFNPLMTAQIGREVMAAHLLTWGNCYAEKVYNGYGEIIELWPIAPNRVYPHTKDGKVVYDIIVDREKITLGRDNILHIAGLGFDGFMGYSVINMARKSIGLSMAMETFGSLYFGEGTHPGAVITHPNVLKDPKGFRDAFDDVYKGLGQSHRVALLQEGMTLQKIGIPAEDAQFLESRQFQIPEVARWYNLPPHKLKDLSKSSFNNIESEQISFVTDSILPWLIRIEQNLDMQLLDEDEKIKQLLYFRHNVDGLLRGSSKDRAEYYRLMWNIGAFSQNDIRAKENMDRIDHEYADDYFVPLNMVPLSKLDEQLAKQDRLPVTPNTDTPATQGGKKNG